MLLLVVLASASVELHDWLREGTCLCLSLIERVILCSEPWMKHRGCKGAGHMGLSINPQHQLQRERDYNICLRNWSSQGRFPGGGGLSTGRAEVQDRGCHVLLFLIPTDTKLRSYFLCPSHLLPGLFSPSTHISAGLAEEPSPLNQACALAEPERTDAWGCRLF